MALPTHDLERLPDAESPCLRCGELMKTAGTMTLPGGHSDIFYPTPGFGSDDSALRGVVFEVLICPKCGKVEFYV